MKVKVKLSCHRRLDESGTCAVADCNKYKELNCGKDGIIEAELAGVNLLINPLIEMAIDNHKAKHRAELIEAVKKKAEMYEDVYDIQLGSALTHILIRKADFFKELDKLKEGDK